jgi:hypothetical protein
MKIERREFIGSAVVAGVGATVSARAQEAPQQRVVPTKTVTVERLFKSPDRHPNALEAAPDGLWIGDQVSEKVHKVDWQTGKVLAELQTQAHNTSGIAVGGGYLWSGSNGGVSGRRPPRPDDRDFGEITQSDLKTGKLIKAWRLKWPGGIHGITFVPQTQTLWVTALSLQSIAELDVKNNLNILRLFHAPGQRHHGLDWDSGTMWVLYASDRIIRQYDPSSGRELQNIQLNPTGDPDPHGLAIHNGYMYYCDAGLTAPGPGSVPGMICRFKIPV